MDAWIDAAAAPRPGRAAALLGGLAVLLAVANVGTPPMYALDVEARLGVPMLFLALLGALAAALVWLAGRARAARGADPRGRYVAAAVLLAGAAAVALVQPRWGLGVFCVAAAAGVAVVAGLFAAARAERRRLTDAPEPPLREPALTLARAVPPATAAIVCLLLIVAFGVGGTIDEADVREIQLLDLNEEQTIPAAFSAALLLVAAGLAALLAAIRPPAERWGWLGVAIALAALGIDEVAVAHEALQEEFDVKGQVFLAPFVILGVAGWWRIRARLAAAPPAGRLMVAGALLWAASQGVDLLQDPPDDWMWTVVPEEMLEMAGSTLFGLALLTTVRAE